MRLALASALACASAVALWPSGRAAALDDSPRVGVLAFEGRRGAAMRGQVVKALRGRAAFVARSRITARARQLRVSVSDAAGRVAVADALEIDLFFTGRVEGRGRAEQTTLEVVDASGRAVAERTVGSYGGAGRNRVRAAARELLGEAIRIVREAEAEAERARAEEEARRQREEAEAARLAEAETARSARADVHEAGTPAGAPRIAMALGAGLRDRRLTVDLESGERRGYASGTYAELRAGLVVWPLARRGAGQGLFLSTWFGGAFGLSARTTEGDAVDAETFRVDAQVGYDTRVGRVALGGALGYTWDRLLFGDNAVFVGAESHGLDAVGRFVVLAHPRAARITVSGGMSLPLAYGALADAYGAGTRGAGGFGALSLDGSVRSGFYYRVDARAARTRLRPSGNAELAPAERGRDRDFRGSVNVGWAF